MEAEHARDNEPDLNEQLRHSAAWSDVPVSLPPEDPQPSQPFMHHHAQRPLVMNDEDLYRIVGATFPQQQSDLQFDHPIDAHPSHDQLNGPAPQSVHLQQAHVTQSRAAHFAHAREQLSGVPLSHNISQPFADTFLPPSSTPHQSLPLPASTAPASLATTESAIPHHPMAATNSSSFKASLLPTSPPRQQQQQQQQQPQHQKQQQQQQQQRKQRQQHKHQQQSTPFQLQKHIAIPPPTPSPPPTSDAAEAADAPRKLRAQQRRRPSVLRSAVEEARLSAQREAESFAHSRRDTWRRDNTNTKTLSGGSNSSATHDGSSEKHSSKRSRLAGIGGDAGGGSDNVRRPNTGSVVGGGGGEGGGDEGEKDSKERESYQRRLDMNRKSAAVSRVKRRAYVRELEERLAAVEAEKLQMENKLEFLQAQNLSYRKQMDNLFIMLASGRRFSPSSFRHPPPFSPTVQRQPIPQSLSPSPHPLPAPASGPTPPPQFGITAQHDNDIHPSGLISQQQRSQPEQPQLSLPLSCVEDLAYATNSHLDLQQPPPPPPTARTRAAASVSPIHSQAFMQSGGMASNNP